ncbi:MFS transporter [Streptomyces sp. NPDC101733]|uniref:MFS transporter n=1 Tax=unclassified Streptomyces TaxID=2593676 RepID=UPI00380D6E6D
MSHDTRESLPGSGATPAGRTSPPGSQIMLAVVLIGELMAVLDASVVDTALPTIQADTGASAAGLQWTHAAYALALGIGLITGGRLGDLYGRKRTFLFGTGAFTAASLLCTLAIGPATLIAARAVQGAGAAVMIPQVLATLHVTFSNSGKGTDNDNDNGSDRDRDLDRAKAFGLYGTVLSIGSAAGPVLGGVLTQADLFGLGWRSIFLINVPLGIATVLLGHRYMTESRDMRAPRLDPLGMVLSALGLLLIAYPLSAGGAQHWPWWTFTAMAAGVAVLVGLVVQQRTRTREGGYPLLELSLFSGRPFSGGLTVQLVFGLLSGLFFMCWTLFMQQGLGMSPSRAAVGFLLLTLAEITGAWPAMAAVARHQRRAPQAGALLAASALASLHLLATTYGTGLSMTTMALPVLALGFGLGMIGAPLTDLTIGRVDDAHAGSASGLFNTATHLGIALGVVLTGVVFFAHDQSATARGGEVVDAFIATLPYVIGGLLIAWALMFLLPRAAPRRTLRR